MLLRDIPFEPVSNASGARNFFGDGYWFHGAWNLLTKGMGLAGIKAGLTYDGANFIAKTTTRAARKGNMPLRHGSTQPRELMPKCIVVKPQYRCVLNKVGLSGPGIDRLLDEGYWQERTRPFFVSFTATGAALEERLEDTRLFAMRLADRLPGFRTRIGLQVNFSCPNVGHGAGEYAEGWISEVGGALDILAGLLPDVPLVPKLSVDVHPAIAAKIARHPALDALTVSNTISWGAYPHRIDWIGMFGSTISPLRDLDGPGGGGLSGAPLLPFVLDWLAAARREGLDKPVFACGGIVSPSDVRKAKDAGASGIEVGSASILCPWNVQPILDEARRRFR